MDSRDRGRSDVCTRIARRRIVLAIAIMCIAGWQMPNAVSEWISIHLPWASDVFPWLIAVKEWLHTVEGVVLVIGLFWIVRRLRRERIKIAALIGELANQIETVGQQALAAREAAESIPVVPGDRTGAGGSGAEWDEIRSEWQTVRERIELAIKRIGHKAVRGKYAKIPRYNYRDVIVALAADGEIKSQAELALLSMNTCFLKLRSRPVSATPADVAQFKEWHRLVNGSLPKVHSKATPAGFETPPALQAAE